jgi:hypothetical protein
MIKILTFSILAAFVSGQAADLSPRFVKALHMVETSGRLGPIRGDKNSALGSLQIHRKCWQDAIEFNKSIGGRYEDCARHDYSVKIFTAYLKRYGQRFIDDQDYESLARIWNGGPQGYNNPKTKLYAQRVMRYMRK